MPSEGGVTTKYTTSVALPFDKERNGCKALDRGGKEEGFL